MLFALFFASIRLLEDVTADGITYSLNTTTNTATIIRSTCPESDTTLTIPSTVTSGGTTYSVTAIGDSAFEGCIHYTGDLVIPESITSVGYTAFADCGFTGSLTFNGACSIGSSVFAGSDKWTGDVIIGDRVTSIEIRAFDNVLVNCKTLTLGSGLQSIGSMAFHGCHFTNNELVIPSNVQSLGGYFISEVSGISSLKIEATLNVLKTKSMGGLDNFDGTLTIGDNIQSLEDYCLSNITSFSKIVFGSGLKTLGSFSSIDNS